MTTPEEQAAEVLHATLHPRNPIEAVPDAVDPRHRVAACYLCIDLVSALAPLFAEERRKGAEEAEATHRDLVSRLGFGNNITEPMADNDTIVAWFEQQSRDASEWQESQLWRNDCYAAGHADDEDCFECDPGLRLEAAEATVARVEALADEWRWLPVWGPDDRGLHILDGVDHEGLMDELRAALSDEERP